MNFMRSVRPLILLFCIAMLLISWEYQKVSPALAAASIPEEAIRLRILANSDGARDQWIKLKIRDRIVESMNTWVANPDSADVARQEVQARLPDFERVVKETLLQYGISQPFTVSFGQVEFPTKRYGQKLYPAGDYEALLIKLGEGKGLNWWCVLFPPLCFIEIASSETLSEVKPAAKMQVESENASVAEDAEVRFFIVDLFSSLFGKVKSWF